MTEDYKKILLQYFTGNLDIEQGNNQPNFQNQEFFLNYLAYYLEELGVRIQTETIKLIRGKNASNQEIDFCLFTALNFLNNKSFIVILDYQLKPLQFIENYESGTPFGIFEELIIDDDGRFYGVENVSGVRRFIMLNNILIRAKNETEFKVILRRSYNLPSSLQTVYNIKLIKKSLGNRYLFTADTTNDLSTQYPIAVELIINVGSPNEWNEFTFTTYNCRVLDSWANWDTEDNLDFRLVCFDAVNLKIYILNKNGSMIGLEKTYDFPGSNNYTKLQATILNINNIYLTFGDWSTGVPYNQYIYKLNNTVDLIYKSDNVSLNYTGEANLYSRLFNDKENAYIFFNYETDTNYKYYAGIIVNDNAYVELLENTADNYSLIYGNVYKQFNLYSFSLLQDNSNINLYLIYNNLDYNGEKYINTNVLVPKSSVLYNETSPIFARNIYNKVIRNNTTISSVEVPNRMLNNETIAKQCLVGETNYNLIENIENINKNIYEVLDINFYNTINILNNNNINNPIYNEIGAKRINISVNQNIDYENAKAIKIRINYSDNTNKIQNVIWSPIRNYFMVVFAIYVEKEIDSIDIISNDENTTYCTIKDTFTVGNIYKIEQDVYIDYKIPPEQVFYNTDEVYYNDEQVYY